MSETSPSHDGPAVPNDTLADALDRYEIRLAADAVTALDRYARALWEINRSLNLTRHTTFEKFVTRDVVDSLQLANLLEDGERVLDLGTGGGVPGMVIAIVRPGVDMELCDSVAKKARAARQIAAQAGLSLPLHHCRGEELLKRERFDTVVARAVAPLKKTLTWLSPHWSNVGRLLLIKGAGWAEERGEARHLGHLKNLELRRVATYETPGTGAENVVLKIWLKRSG
jgi:16S rRNA (guanine527-N7)-methyltransferase